MVYRHSTNMQHPMKPVSCVVLIISLSSLDCDEYKWTGIGDEGAIALSDQRVIRNFQKLK